MTILYLWIEFDISYRIQSEEGRKSRWAFLAGRWRFIEDMSDREYDLLYREQGERWQEGI